MDVWDSSALIRGAQESNVDIKVAWSKMVKYRKNLNLVAKIGVSHLPPHPWSNLNEICTSVQRKVMRELVESQLVKSELQLVELGTHRTNEHRLGRLGKVRQVCLFDGCSSTSLDLPISDSTTSHSISKEWRFWWSFDYRYPYPIMLFFIDYVLQKI